MSQYGKSEYWEERYTRDPEPFDWYQRLTGIKDLLLSQQEPFLTPESAILNIGCGNSRLSEELFDEGYQNIYNIDISAVCIKAMQEKYKDKGPNFQYSQMDVRDMSAFKAGQFDCVIDKGTLDSVLCGDSSTSNVQKMLNEIHRVLTPNGVYFVVSYGQPEHRLLYLDKLEYDWTVVTQQVNKPTISNTISLTGDDKDSPNVHYIYICKKKGQGEQQQQDNQE
ncbi:hypothetical protein PPERSA_01509 [Pseudocohnilembus persalinus]|uniref:Methyltransferase type 11 domain-containing protein n=1 Tax=Pseudocohnilembus persalinus TaxID=266149 RepID=A0A0V0R7N3_PSEPJ|nr:hypothetical protein PPERSA_01509 [Pseudocohnilembus persalinus]|eukprot:KRX10497.1 hypothetical protein PPERSA_01509 [Pseudocohnilembus persalinus]